VNSNSLIEEIIAAARGCWGILAGNRAMANQLDGSWSGVATSTISVLVALGAQAMLQLPLPADVIAPMPLLVLFHLLAINIAGFYGVYLFLRTKGKPFDIASYIAAHNWSNFFFLIIALLLTFVLPGLIGSLIITIATAVFYVRAAAFLLDIRGPDLALMIGAQLLAMLGCLVVLMFLGGIIPGLGFRIIG
jgi:hypothetical protein